jgi:putative sterol carrier protein
MEPPDAIPEFFQKLRRREHEPLLAKVTGRVRFDLIEAGRPDRWVVVVDKGDTTVLHNGGPADCTIRADRTLFEGLCRGEENAIAAVLRGALVCTGMSSCCSRSSGSFLDRRVNGALRSA